MTHTPTTARIVAVLIGMDYVIGYNELPVAFRLNWQFLEKEGRFANCRKNGDYLRVYCNYIAEL